jgi:hypothetical protein
MGSFASFTVAKKILELVSEFFCFAVLEAYVDTFQNGIAIWVLYSHESLLPHGRLSHFEPAHGTELARFLTQLGAEGRYV